MSDLPAEAKKPSFVIIIINGVRYNRIITSGIELESFEYNLLPTGFVRTLYFDFEDTSATFDIQVIRCSRKLFTYHIVWGCTPSDTHAEVADKSYRLLHLIERLI